MINKKLHDFPHADALKEEPKLIVAQIKEIYFGLFVHLA